MMAALLPIDDPRFQQGKQFAKEKKYTEAVEFLNSLLQSACEKYGDQSIECAPVWYEYGNILLEKEEENPSDSLLGVAATEAKKAAQLLGANDDPAEETETCQNDEGGQDDDDQDEDQDDGDDGQDGNAAPGDAPNDQQEEEEQDMEMAWEALEVARLVYEQHPSPENNGLLAKVSLCAFRDFHCRTVSVL
jgi:hypothetical protein